MSPMTLVVVACIAAVLVGVGIAYYISRAPLRGQHATDSVPVGPE